MRRAVARASADSRARRPPNSCASVWCIATPTSRARHPARQLADRASPVSCLRRPGLGCRGLRRVGRIRAHRRTHAARFCGPDCRRLRRERRPLARWLLRLARRGRGTTSRPTLRSASWRRSTTRRAIARRANKCWRTVRCRRSNTGFAARSRRSRRWRLRSRCRDEGRTPRISSSSLRLNRNASSAHRSRVRQRHLTSF